MTEMRDRKSFSLREVVCSFGYALEGLRFLERTQRNVRIHSVVTVLVVGLSVWLRLDPVRFCLIIFAVIGVWVAETFNTALEIMMDDPKMESAFVKPVKDVAAAAVLLASAGAIVIGLIVLGPPLLAKFA